MPQHHLKYNSTRDILRVSTPLVSFRTVTIICNYSVCLFSSFFQNEVIFSLLFPQQLAKCPEQSWIVSKGGGKGIFLRRHLLIQFSRSVVSDSLWPHESQHARPPCPSPSPGVHSDPRPSSPWCHPAISSSDQSNLERSSVSEKLTQKFYSNADEISAVLISK